MFLVLDMSCAMNFVTARIRRRVMDNVAIDIILKTADVWVELIGSIYIPLYRHKKIYNLSLVSSNLSLLYLRKLASQKGRLLNLRDLGNAWKIESAIPEYRVLEEVVYAWVE